MGLCCSCCGGADSDKSTEMSAMKKSGRGGKRGESSLSISRKMSAPSTMSIGGTPRVTGHGLALVDVSVEQDSAYWEWSLEIPSRKRKKRILDSDDENDDGGTTDVADDGAEEEEHDEEFDTQLKFGVTTKKSPEFYKNLEANETDDSSIDDGTLWMRCIPRKLYNGDTIGIAVQQSDLPMIQFYHNGEPCSEVTVNRFRGSVYPSIYVWDGVSARACMEDEEWNEGPPHERFGPLIAARGII